MTLSEVKEMAVSIAKQFGFCCDVYYNPFDNQAYIIEIFSPSNLTLNKRHEVRSIISYGFLREKMVNLCRQLVTKIDAQEETIRYLEPSMEIKKVIFNDPATIVYWQDGSKTVVKCGELDTYDPEKGLAMAIAKKVMGNKGNYYNEFRKWLPKEEPYISDFKFDFKPIEITLDNATIAFDNLSKLMKEENDKLEDNLKTIECTLKVIKEEEVKHDTNDCTFHD